MKNNKYKDSVECCECGETHLVTVYPYKSGYTSGLPEDCYEPEGGYIVPDKCPDCGTTLYHDDVN